MGYWSGIGPECLWRRGFFSGEDGFAAAEEGIAVEHDDAAAAGALHFDIGAGADDGPGVAAAGMRFAGSDEIAEENGGFGHRRWFLPEVNQEYHKG